jgi:hypothetical protein
MWAESYLAPFAAIIKRRERWRAKQMDNLLTGDCEREGWPSSRRARSAVVVGPLSANLVRRA